MNVDKITITIISLNTDILYHDYYYIFLYSLKKRLQIVLTKNSTHQL